MAFIDVLVAFLVDPFRIGLLIALLLTTRNTAAHTGRILPIGLGIVFVAVLLALTTATPEAANTDRAMAIGVGVAANAIIVGIVVLVAMLGSKLSSR